MTVWTKQAKTSTTYNKDDLRRVESLFLLQTGDDFLLQDGGFFLTSAAHISWVKDALRSIANVFLLLEDGFRILNEDLSRMILEQSSGWTKQAKRESSYTKDELRRVENFLLLQTGDQFLLQTGGNFLISAFRILWTKEAK